MGAWSTAVPDGPDVAALGAQLRAATAIAARAAKLAVGMRDGGVLVEEKGPGDLVSEADRAVERLIVDGLAESFAGDGVVGEEGASRSGTGRTWYVDPIDGTTNYLKGLPTWGVSLGLADERGHLLLGVVAMPATDEVFAAARGLGATRNGVPIRCSTVDRLDRTLIAHAHSPASAADWGGPAAVRAAAGGLMRAALGTRMQGCAVADLTSVAVGRIDACFVGGMHPWDVAAGLLIAAEAGVRITTPDGTVPAGPAPSFVASPPGVHTAMREVLTAHGAVAG